MLSTIALSSAVMFVGARLWRRGFVTFRDDLGRGSLLDVAVLALAMEALHSNSYLRWLLSWVHETHHDFTRPRPLDLFALNPLECMGLGGLWRCRMAVCPSY